MKKQLTFLSLLIISLSARTVSAGPLENLLNELNSIKKTFESAASGATTKQSSPSINQNDSSEDLFGNAGKSTSSAVATHSSKIVEATGVGETLDLAKEDAIRQAVQKAVGSYVSSDLITKNDDVIKDKVISLSAGFVEKTEITLQNKREDGLFETKIKATVTSTKLRRALEDQNIATTDLDSESLFGEALTKLDNTNSTLTLWDNLLKKLMVSGFTAKLIGKPSIEPISGDEVFLSFKVLLDWNSDYKKEVSNLLKTTSQRIYSISELGGACQGVWIDSSHQQCVEFKDLSLRKHVEQLFLKYNSPIQVELDIKSKSGEKVGYIANCFGTNLSGFAIVNPFVVTENGVQLFINEQSGNAPRSMSNLNRFGLASLYKPEYVNSSFSDKVERPLIEPTNTAGVYITLSAVMSKNDLLQFNFVDVKTSSCSRN